MLNSKFLGIFALTVSFVSLTLPVCNFAYADEKQPKGSELFEVLKPPTCPTCKRVPASHTKERVLAPLITVCPECKKEASELRVYHCDECKKKFLACLMCQGTSKVVTKGQMVKSYLQRKSR